MSTTTTPRDASTVSSMSVTDLLQEVSKGDPAAWEEVEQRYRSLVVAKVRSFWLQEADAHDAVQMTWLRLAENCHRIQSPEHLGGWLTTVASRECLSILRRATHSPDRIDTAIENLVDLSVNPEQHVIDMDTVQALRTLVAELPSRKRTLLRALFADEPPPYAELARITGIAPGSIGPIRARLLRQLRQQLDEDQLGQAGQ